ncbi:hypothetical protein EHI8A_068070 [Entamoeba histolytica HM-1:IMSS-B]|uniref:Uncharacterized protein n=6 Tax=Entamoeba histolytica TaxID=5759 RepID=C4LZA4_ENTH1|nr:hypothetical protein EHI_000530 [Entamoeba histolytica HM-1:IMSS]EMD43937.1 Hypothetical protein EHI5A_099400 [Entamoeba histolytica KU27]EMH72088.1 hypothetical protein EHI8A_068070 [Entamoeba histolytica HM-1:IMSS-B]EMS13041.1 hypothetical protein KM1_124240 [Entamoeba histolytica HM-3:IMSS]ENY62222.1 hypothetical protein EHI7A_065470 [Entamoeba histolytica HM-1:IMSS-A]GAT94185.1 hypothetical protein CL6EHI_000530 [Entamoeba histolytica]|eukprot:XP_652758.1 hypothetical protein EHI_000530 [Entamoeba histolytica HM-1:IMSS]
MKTIIKEIIQTDQGFHYLFTVDNKIQIVDANKAVVTREIDLRNDTVLYTPHKVMYNEGRICFVSQNGIEFFSVYGGSFEFIGLINQAQLIDENNSPIYVTDVSLDKELITFSSNIGKVLLMDYPSLKMICQIPLTKTPLRCIKLSRNDSMLYGIDVNGIFVAVELHHFKLYVMRVKAEEDLREYFNKIDDMNLTLTKDGCLIQCDGQIAQYRIDMPSIFKYQIKGVEDVKCIEDKIYISTLNQVYIFDQCNEEVLQQFTFNSQPQQIMKTVITYPNVLLYTINGITSYKIPTIPQRMSVIPKKSLNVLFKSIKIPNNLTLLQIQLGNDREIYGFDLNGTIYHCYLPKSLPSSSQVYFKMENSRTELERCYITSNGNYGLFSVGNKLLLQEFKTGNTHVLYTPKQLPDDSVNIITVCSSNSFIVGVGCFNGNVFEINSNNSIPIQINSHLNSPIVGIGFINKKIISLSENGILNFDGKTLQLSISPISMDIFNEFIIINDLYTVTLYSINNWKILYKFESPSPIIDAKFSCDGKFIVCVSKDRCNILRSSDLGVCTYLLVSSLQTQLKLNTQIVGMTVSKIIPCQFAVSFQGGVVMLIEPRTYSDWIY